jgi:hypothetical protein
MALLSRSCVVVVECCKNDMAEAAVKVTTIQLENELSSYGSVLA